MPTTNSKINSPAKYRQESDRFGTCDIPEDALYGIQTYRTVENMTFSGKQLSNYPELVVSLALVKKACCLTNQKDNHLTEAQANAIAASCDQIIAGSHKEQFHVDVLHGGGGIGYNVNINEVIANLANIYLGGKAGDYTLVDPKTHVNKSQSTADVIHTAFRMTIAELHNGLDCALKNSVDILRSKTIEFANIETVARTCLQDAMPVSLSSLIDGYEKLLDRRRQKLFISIADLAKVNLGGTVIGSGTGASNYYQNNIIATLSKVAGKNFTRRESLYDAAQNSDDILNVAKDLKQLADALLKIARDFRLLSSGPVNGFNEIKLPNTQDGSSFFTAKNNPVIAETLMHCCMQVTGYTRAAEASIEQSELNLNVFETVAAINTIDSIIALTKALESFNQRCLKGLVANEAQCAENVRRLRDNSHN